MAMLLLLSLLLSAATAQTSPECPDDWITVAMVTAQDPVIFCIQASSAEVTWSSARAACLDQQAHLLSLDDAYYADLGATDLSALHDRLGEIVTDPVWTSLERKGESGKLWWDVQVPTPVQALTMQTSRLVRWAAGQPDDSAGECGLLRPAQPAKAGSGRLELSLDDCHQRRPFVCAKPAPRPLQPQEVCDAAGGWIMVPDTTLCLYHSAASLGSYQTAKQGCRQKGATLAEPRSPALRDATARLVAAAASTNQAWIGLTRPNRNNKDSFRWESRADWVAGDSQVGPDSADLPGRCVKLDSGKAEGQQWVPEPCKEELPFLCTKEQSSPPPVTGRSSVTVQPQSTVVRAGPGLGGGPGFSWGNIGRPQAAKGGGGGGGGNGSSLSCHITNRSPGSHMAWVKDGVYLDAGPDGLDLSLDAALLERLRKIQGGGARLEGRYYCRGWSAVPYTPVASRIALVTVEDLLLFRLSAPLAAGRPEDLVRPERLLYSPSSAVLQDALQALHNVSVVELGGKRFTAEVLLDGIRHDERTVDITLRYDVAGVNPGPLLQGRGPRGGGLSQAQRLAHAFYVAIRRQLSGGGLAEQLASVNASAAEVLLRAVGFCPEQEEGSLIWRPARKGKSTHTRQICLHSRQRLGRARCQGNFTYGAELSNKRYVTDCQNPPKSNFTEPLLEIIETEVNETNAPRVASVLVKLTSAPESLTPTDVSLCSEVLELLAQSTPHPPAALAQPMVATVSNLQQVPPAALAEAQTSTDAASRSVKALETFAERASLNPGHNSLVAVQPKLALHIIDIPVNETAAPIGWGMSGSELNAEAVAEFSALDEPNLRSAVLVPADAIERAQEAWGQWGDEAESPPGRLTFILYSSPALFLEQEEEAGGDVSERGPDGEIEEAEKGGGRRVAGRPVSSMVVAAALGGVRISGLSQPVETVLVPDTPAQNATNYTCVFWSPAERAWSDEGCEYVGRRGDAVVCHCSHLTNFAILTDVSREDISEEHHLALTLITYIGLAFSIVGLSATILSFLLFKKLRRGRCQKVLVCLAACLLGVDVVFVVGIERTDAREGCAAVAVLLHYLLLAAFAWMLVEAVLHYLRFVRVLDTYVESFMCKASLPAWLLPAIPVAAVAGYDWTLFLGSDRYCWLSPPAFYYAFLLPVAIIIFINTTMFIIIIKGMTCDRPRGLQTTQSRHELVGLQVQASVCCFILLGLTWVFGFLAVSDARLVFQYLFCIFNSLQGFFIFLLHCVRERSVRQAWRECCCSRRGPASKYASSNNTDSSDLRLNSRRYSSKI